MSEMAESTGGATETDAGAAETETQEQQTQEAPENPVLAKMDEMAQRFAAIEDRLPAPSEPEAEPEFDPAAVMYPELVGTPEGEQAEQEAREQALREDAQGVMRLADQIAERKVAERMAPIEQRLFHQDLAAFTEKYPTMADPEKAKPYIEQARAYLGREDVDLATLELFYLAGQARERAASEQPVGSESEVPLEAGGGGQPGEQDVDLAAQILAAGGGGTGAIRDFI